MDLKTGVKNVYFSADLFHITAALRCCGSQFQAFGGECKQLL